MASDVRPDKTDVVRKAVGLAVIVTAILLLFWSGYRFKVFGYAADPIRYPEQFAFIACIVLVGFGMGYIGGGVRGGAKSACSVAGLLLAAILIGQVRKVF